jgi:SPW repeat
MIITIDELKPATPPEKQDRVIAAKTSSVVCLFAGLWFFVSPLAFFGVSEQRDGWNSWIVGALIFLVACARMRHPMNSTLASYINAVLGAWVFISPWVFGYTADTGRFVNSLAVGLVVMFFALDSASVTRIRKVRFVRTPH